MIGDAVYRFLTLRDPDDRTGIDKQRGSADARLVDAVGAGEPSALVSEIATALTTGDVAAARAAASQFLTQRADTVATQADREMLAAGAELRRRLAAAAAANDADDQAKAALESLEAIGIDGGVERGPAIDAWRTTLGDLLVADVLADRPWIDRSDACASICAAEAAIRLLNGGQPGAAPWRPVAVHGVVILPAELTAVARTGAPRPDRRELLERGTHEPAKTGLTPAELVASGAVRTYVGDLIVLDQQLRRYELGEIAHIENVLLTEQFERVHRDLRRVEVQVIDETETETINERDLQSTDREELRSELAKAVRENIHIGAYVSATVSGKTPYGQYVVGVGGNFAYDRASEQREERSQAHAREVVERARQQITERTRASRSTTTTTEDEDTTTHGFDNRQGDEHVVGVYRWVEKTYDLHLINYGRRVFYEFTIPEPAAFWRAVSARRTAVSAGPAPDRPALAPEQDGGARERLAAAHLVLRDANGVATDFPTRWLDLVALAGDWGVQLPAPPPVTQSLQFEVAVPPLTDDPAAKEIHAFGDGGGFFYESVQPRTSTPEKPPTVPDGYEATSGEVAFTGWMVAAKTVGGVPGGAPYATRLQFERGTAFLQVGGRQETFSIGINGSGPETRAMNTVFANGLRLRGDVPVALTTTLNGAMCSVRLSCARTDAAETRWIADVLDRFATAYAERVAEHDDAVGQSELDQRQRDFLRTEATYRGIERRELKRQIIDLLFGGQLEALGNGMVDPPGADADGHVLAGDIDASRLPVYSRVLEFVERAFDWTNLVYTFAPYFFGRAPDWESSALADEGDEQFSAFLGAGAARVQLPTQRGFESFVDAFFAGIGNGDITETVPWLPSGRSLALDLAGQARDGFDLWPGRISIPADSNLATVIGNTFDPVGDVNRELRIEGHIFRIVRVVSPTELELDRVASDTAIDRVEYERGGLVIGPPIALELPSTLVAIDVPGLRLPEFPGRYA